MRLTFAPSNQKLSDQVDFLKGLRRIDAEKYWDQERRISAIEKYLNDHALEFALEKKR